LAADSVGNLYIADTGTGTVRKLVLASGAVTTLVGVSAQMGVKPGPLPARLNRPGAVALTPNGQLTLADNTENAVLAVY
jgi:hypothetical protein